MKYKIILPVVITLVLCALYTCEINRPDIPDGISNEIVIDAPEVINQGYNDLELKAYIYINEDQHILDHGFCWNTEEHPTKEHNYRSFGAYNPNDDYSFSNKISGLDAGVTYYIRVYAQYNEIIIYGDQLEVTTTASGLPVVNTIEPFNIGKTSAISGGHITSDGGDSVTIRGVCWSTTIEGLDPEGPNSKTKGSDTGVFTITIEGLVFNQVYYVCAFAKNSNGCSHGQEKPFVTENVDLPVVEIHTITNVTQTSASVEGEVTYEGPGGISEVGVLWSTTIDDYTLNLETADDNKTSYYRNDKTFGDEITGLTLGQTYNVRTYAKNADGTGYSRVIHQFTTLYNAPVASFTTSANTIKVGESVHFTDNSTNNPTTWAWNFGDETTSSEQDPDHIYMTPGTFTVTLTVSNSGGSDTETATITVNSRKILYIGADPTLGETRTCDEEMFNRLVSWGFDVTYLDDSDYDIDGFNSGFHNSFDGVFFGESTSSTLLTPYGENGANFPIPAICLELNSFQNEDNRWNILTPSTDVYYTPASSNVVKIKITNTSHYITEIFEMDEIITWSSAFIFDAAVPCVKNIKYPHTILATPIVEYPDYPDAIAMGVVDASGTKIFFLSNTAPYLENNMGTVDFYKIIKRAAEYIYYKFE